MAKNYLNNKDLRDEIIKSKAEGQLTPKALEMLMLLTSRLSTKFTYVYYQDREDCESFAIMDCLQYFNGYDPEKSANAFAYFTQMIKNGFSKGWKKLYGNCPLSKKISISTNKIYSI